MVDLTEVSTEGWFSRIIGSIKSVIVGLVLAVGAFPLLWVNEGCAVRTAKGLAEGRGIVVSVSANAVAPANEGKLVHMTGRAESWSGVRDSQFGVEAKDAVSLTRDVEMYQWKENVTEKKEKQVGGSEKTIKETTYVKEWSSSPIDSSRFKLQKNSAGESLHNPSMAYREQTFAAADVHVAAFSLNAGLVSQMGKRQRVVPDAAAISHLPAELRARAKIDGDRIYIGGNPASPAIGDMRITFDKTPAGDVSVIAQQRSAALMPYLTSQKTEINLLDDGIQTADQMFSSAEAANTLRTWILRFVGFLLMFMGFSLVFRPLSVVADVVPLIGSLVGAGTAFVAFALAAPLSFLTIAIAWIAYRPVLGGILLAGGLAVFIGLFVLARRKRAGK